MWQSLISEISAYHPWIFIKLFIIHSPIDHYNRSINQTSSKSDSDWTACVSSIVNMFKHACHYYYCCSLERLGGVDAIDQESTVFVFIENSPQRCACLCDRPSTTALPNRQFNTFSTFVCLWPPVPQQLFAVDRRRGQTKTSKTEQLGIGFVAVNLDRIRV